MLIANTLGILFFLYLIWRTLKEDYHFEKVFNLGFISLLLVFLSYLASRFVGNSIFSFWIYLLLVSVGFLVLIKKQKMKFFESFEAFFIAFLPWVGLSFLSEAISYSSLLSFLLFWITLICLFIYFFLKAHYREYAWYKSGRVGFAGVTALVVFCLSRALIIITFLGVTVDILFSISASLLLFGLLYNLFRKNGK